MLRSERAAGWLEWAPTLAALESKRGPIHRSRIGVIAKTKSGKRKVRLIHDLRRSGVNARSKTHERVALRKLTGVVGDALELVKTTGAANCDFTTSDFQAAFKQMKMNKQAQRCLGDEGLLVFFFYLFVLLGIKIGPLLWARTASLLMRLTAAAIHDTPSRLQCFVVTRS